MSEMVVPPVMHRERRWISMPQRVSSRATHARHHPASLQNTEGRRIPRVLLPIPTTNPLFASHWQSAL